jgi:hypothetical protein
MRVSVAASLADAPPVCQLMLQEGSRSSEHQSSSSSSSKHRRDGGAASAVAGSAAQPAADAEALALSHYMCQLCVVGSGFEVRAASTAALVVDAVRLLERQVSSRRGCAGRQQRREPMGACTQVAEGGQVKRVQRLRLQ